MSQFVRAVLIVVLVLGTLLPARPAYMQDECTPEKKVCLVVSNPAPEAGDLYPVQVVVRNPAAETFSFQIQLTHVGEFTRVESAALVDGHGDLRDCDVARPEFCTVWHGTRMPDDVTEWVLTINARTTQVGWASPSISTKVDLHDGAGFRQWSSIGYGIPVCVLGQVGWVCPEDVPMIRFP